MSGDNGSSGKSNGVHRQFRRLCEVQRRCKQIMSQVLGAGDYRHEDLPRPLARLLGRCGCNIIFNVINACLMRLLAESIVPRPAGNPSPPDGTDEGQANALCNSLSRRRGGPGGAHTQREGNRSDSITSPSR